MAAWGLGGEGNMGFGICVCICRMGHGKAWRGAAATWYEEDCGVGLGYVIA